MITFVLGYVTLGLVTLLTYMTTKKFWSEFKNKANEFGAFGKFMLFILSSLLLAIIWPLVITGLFFGDLI